MSHILDLLAEWFEPSQLTQKLLDHLESWLDPKALFALEKAWAAGDEALIPAAILHLFHKLPSVTGSVASYLESSDKRLGLVVVSIHLETALLGSPGLHTPGTSYPTPFRLPLALFLAAHAPESIAYFLTPKRFVSAAYFHLLIDVLLSPAGAPLVAELKAHPERILEAGGIAPGSAPNTSPEGMELAVRALELIKTLIQLDPSWVSSHETLRTALLERWHAQDALAPSQPPHLRGEGLETSFLLVCLMALLRESIQPDLLLSLVAPLRKRLEVEVTPLKAFLAQEIPEKATSDEVASILEEVTTRLVEIYSSQEIRTGEPPSEEGRVRQLDVALALQYIVRPCLLAHAKKGTVRECLHDPIFSSLLDTVLERSPEDAKEDGEERRVQANVVPELAEQIMQLTIVLMQQCPDELHGKGRDYRRGLIRVPWHYLKNETSPVRYTAFMMVCQFMKHMACPEKIYLQVSGRAFPSSTTASPSRSTPSCLHVFALRLAT